MGQGRNSTFGQSENPASPPEEEQTGATGGQKHGRPGEQGGRGVSLAMEAGTAGHEPHPTSTAWLIQVTLGHGTHQRTFQTHRQRKKLEK